mgnify:CR=1 FL=1
MVKLPMANDTIVDIYCHIMPEKFFQEMSRIAPRLGNIAARLRGVKKLFDLDERFREMDQFGDYREIISLPNPPIEDLAAGDVGLDLARIGNDAMAELCARHPERFPTFVAALSMTDVEGSVKEARRAVKELGAGGVQIFTSVAGRPLDDPAIRADLRHHGGVRPSDLAAPGAHRQHAGLPGGAEVPLRDVVVLRLALRHLGGHGADGVQRACSTAIRGSRSSPIISAG